MKHPPSLNPLAPLLIALAICVPVALLGAYVFYLTRRPKAKADVCVRTVSKRVSLATFFLMLTAALLSFYVGDGWHLPGADELKFAPQLILCFPLGLCMWMRFPGAGRWDQTVARTLVPLVLPLCYGVYIAFLVAFIRVRKRRSFTLLCLLFATLLLLNIVGCRQILEGLSHIN
jgi:uncharacterized iron-regulated membrane protein